MSEFFTLLLLLTTAEGYTQSASGSGMDLILRDNFAPSILGCLDNSTHEIRALRSLVEVTEVHLPTFNLTIIDRDGDNFSVKSYATSSPPLSYINATRVNATAALVLLPAYELTGGAEVRLEVEYNRTATDSMGSENSCTQNYLVVLTVSDICTSNYGVPTIDVDASPEFSVDLLITHSNIESTLVKNRVQTAVASILNDFCPNNCQACEMAENCAVFFTYCQRFDASNVKILKSRSTVTTEGGTTMTFTIIVISPTQKEDLGNNMAFSPGALAEILNDHKSELALETGLEIHSVQVTLSTTSGSGNSVALPLIVFFVLLVGVMIPLAAVIVIIWVTYVYKSKNKVPSKPLSIEKKNKNNNNNKD